MNRRLIGVIAGISVLGLGVPAFAAARGGDGTPEDNNVPGDVRGNCDEAEHATDAECLDADPSATTILVTTTAAPATTATTAAPETTAAPTSSIDDDDDAATSTVPATAETVTTVEDISGPCDEAEHADDPRCTGGVVIDNSGPG